ncbi:FAD/NAD(P)-binding domain-containing protein [Coniophora puteana RWD-64-598 SS2]|uniref:FAD/NAD(P)-binding domain-containing protein n=1 Tax=Coniophora puteana (strain RWD-64-598) TaxID=741705 RepID=A0A5M3MPV4_CONPW|nr:FAD/NAD(P)-binding domain-containing protein [Coniophora puteana RWD-64-598 SS2]EIW81163.1 FAD/NAD(P)-binding domain-containing protein [Coniophora puteana RWD-64-598 SS2]
MKVAVVGSGVSGLAATWALNEHSDHEVHLYESDSRTGGHANTYQFMPQDVKSPKKVDVDTGFIVFNPSTYPNFINFLNLHPDITILPTEMTFSVSRDNGLFEWAGNNLSTVFCQPYRLLDPNMWRLVYDVLRFNACSRRAITRGASGQELSIGEYLEREGYSDSFRDNYLIPMTAAIWSTPPDKCSLDFPADTLIQFLSNHHLLQVTGKPSWLTIDGGSRKYVDAIISKLPPSQLHINTPVVALSTRGSSAEPGPVELRTADGRTEIYDRVILACHSDTALAILNAGEGVTSEEKKILGRFSWNRNEVVLHSDPKFIPRSRIARACWNYLTFSEVDEKGMRKTNVDKVSLTYDMNELQHISEKDHGLILVTLNPPSEPDPARTITRVKYDHPIIDAKAVLSQTEISTIQNSRGIAYAGAWLRYGFHEDGFLSGLRAATEHVPGARLPFVVQTPGRRPDEVFAASLFDLFEGTGLRVVVGTVLALGLRVLQVFARPFCSKIATM